MTRTMFLGIAPMDQGPSINPAPDLVVVDLGRMSYATAYEQQEQMHAAVVAAGGRRF